MVSRDFSKWTFSFYNTPYNLSIFWLVMNKSTTTPTKIIVSSINKNELNSEDELMMLNARLIQWCYLNANNELAFENQKLSVESQLLQAWKVLHEKKVGLMNSLRKFELEKDLININETLEFQVQNT